MFTVNLMNFNDFKEFLKNLGTLNKWDFFNIEIHDPRKYDTEDAKYEYINLEWIFLYTDWQYIHYVNEDCEKEELYLNFEDYWYKFENFNSIWLKTNFKKNLQKKREELDEIEKFL